MTSFENVHARKRTNEDGDEFVLMPAAGVDDPRASDAGRALMQLFLDRTGGERLLRRSDFSPLDLKPYLANIIIVDVVYGEDGLVCDGSVRLLGSGLAAFYGEYTGSNITLHPSNAGDRFIAGARVAIETQGSVIGTATQALPERPLYQVITCMTPVGDENGTVVQLIGHVDLVG